MRRNLIKQPSFETVTTEWSATGGTFTTVTGGYSGKAGQLVGAGDTQPTLSTSVSAKAGTEYTFSIYAKGNTPGGVIKVEAYNGATLLSTFNGDAFDNLPTWERKSVTFTTPANTTSVKAIVAASVIWTINTTIQVDSALLEEGALDEYFDGDTQGFAWDDTAGNSTSSSLVSINPGNHARLEVDTGGTWIDITGPTTNISFTFDDSNAATLGAEVLDADLDPLVSNDLRLGKPVRVKGMDVRTHDYSVLYTGTIDNLSVTRNPRETRKVSISLTATNNVTYLAGQTEARGVGTINELRWLVTGVPFNINGSTTPLGSGTVISKNENASIWDNVLITRDSVLGYAWVDKNNVLNAWDHTAIDTSVKAVIGPDTYTDLGIDFNLDQIINSVTVNWQRYNIGTETSSSVPYGPYTDDVSIAQWGVRSAAFTAQGATEDAAAIAAFANDVLTRNATAEIRPDAAVVRINRTHDLRLPHLLDLNSYVDVVYHDGTTTKTMRVTGIKHDISPDTWTVEYAFSAPTGVAAPSVAPATPNAYVPPGSIGESQLDPGVVTDIQNAQQKAQEALTEAEASFAYAQTRNKVYYQTTMPTGGTYAIGDTWFDTDDGNRTYVHNGTTFVDARDTGIAQAISDASAAAAAASTADSKATTAQTTANGKNKVTYSTATPGTTANTSGDIWFQKDASNIIIGQWEGTGGTSWIAKTIGTQVIANLDVAKLTSGTIATPTITLGNASTTGVIESYNYAAAAVGFNLTKNGLTAKGGTITGALLQTDSGANTGMKLMSTGMTAKDSLGNLKLSFTTSTGELVINGPIVSGAGISGSTVTGGTVQTESTASRGIKMNSAGFTAYDSVGNPTLTITASTGAVAMKGDLTAGSNISGATITGSSFNTGNNNGRVVVRQDSGTSTGVVEFFNTVGTQIGLLSASSDSVAISRTGTSQRLDLYSDRAQFGNDVVVNGNLTTLGAVKTNTIMPEYGATIYITGIINANDIRPYSGSQIGFGPDTYVNMPGTVKTGLRTVTVNSSNTNETATVSFPVAFPAGGPVPSVYLTAVGLIGNTTLKLSPSSITRSGFTVNAVRSSGTGNIDVQWLAVTA